MADIDFPGGVRLPIRTRRVVAGGRDTVEREVYCPLRDTSLTIDKCQACEDYAGVSVDVVQERSSVVCRRITVDSARQLIGAYRAASMRRCAAIEPSLAELTSVTEIMTSEVWCVREDLDADEVVSLLLERGMSGVPVVDQAGHPVGLISKTDLVRERAPGATATELMTPLVFSLPERASIAQASALMAFEGVHRLLVLSEDSHVVGLISSLDVLAWMARQSGYLPRRDLGTTGEREA